ncbi:YggS family pyridoxal phosphate-dependent enzyme [Corynebacterium hylobatis]|uniref:Pyridoxal phosphate homeostasis protein n=2 Tax=Corynebacterium TaxID=1716 RepID=A0A3S0BFW4_9CORY|nr:YggS family pyridoxal phosphate-dependent enzyme [Corynebacterium hylobatis]MCS5479361.1 YggS family pyridoxal phosphate-dependent enzyme [Corynebacterium lemuris]RSZ62757.1 YggS family pyridoxal phosphate-dependent enzyme [Corynebacterium hylobatis]
MTRTEELRTNLAAVRARIDAAAEAAGRDPQEIRLLPVTKFHPAADLRLLVELGAADVAENREQEARGKAAEVPEARIHMIGQVQTKKANSVARWAASVHSVDSVRLAQALDRGMALALERGDRTTDVLPVYLQLSADGDPARGGVLEEDLDELVQVVEEAEHLELAGLMVVPPLDSAAGEVFDRARRLCGKIAEQTGRPMELSAGMSGDLEEAVARGSNVVRVGTGVLGARPLP